MSADVSRPFWGNERQERWRSFPQNVIELEALAVAGPPGRETRRTRLPTDAGDDDGIASFGETKQRRGDPCAPTVSFATVVTTASSMSGCLRQKASARAASTSDPMSVSRMSRRIY
jgi:hypothetical protein